MELGGKAGSGFWALASVVDDIIDNGKDSALLPTYVWLLRCCRSYQWFPLGRSTWRHSLQSTTHADSHINTRAPHMWSEASDLAFSCAHFAHKQRNIHRYRTNKGKKKLYQPMRSNASLEVYSKLSDRRLYRIRCLLV